MKYENEINKLKENNELKLKKLILENDLRLSEMSDLIHKLNNEIRSYKHSYIHINDHEILMDKFKKGIIDYSEKQKYTNINI